MANRITAGEQWIRDEDTNELVGIKDSVDGEERLLVFAETNVLTGGIEFTAGATTIHLPDFYTDLFLDCITTGFVLPSSGTIALAAMPSGVAYIGGVRVAKAGELVTLTASKDNYIDLSSLGVYTVTPVTIASAAPAIAANSIRLGYIATDATTITAATSGAKDSLGNWMGNRVRNEACILKRFNNATLGSAVFNLSFPAGNTTFDNAYMHDDANATRITIPRTGLYRVGFNFILASGIVDSVRMKAAGSVNARFPTHFFQSGNLSPNGEFDVYLTAGEYIEMQITPNTGSAPFAYYTHFFARRVG